MYDQLEIWLISPKKESEGVSHSVMSDSLQPLGLYPASLLGPWNFPRQERILEWVYIPFSRGIFPI